MGSRGKAGHFGGGKGLLDSSFRKDGGVFEWWVEAESQATSGGGLSESLRGLARKCKETRKKEGALDSLAVAGWWLPGDRGGL